MKWKVYILLAYGSIEAIRFSESEAIGCFERIFMDWDEEDHYFGNPHIQVWNVDDKVETLTWNNESRTWWRKS